MESCFNKITFSRPNYAWRARSRADVNLFPAEPLQDVCEKRGFSEVHKIVWGISFEDLYTKIQACPEAVDGLDIHGYTPLDYAIAFGNMDHVRLLLSHGTNIGRRLHRLFWTAVESGNCASTQLLLDQGLKPNDLAPRPPKSDLHSPEDKLDRFSFWSFQTFEHYIDSYERCTPAMDRLLVDYGFDFNTRIPFGLTALMACCRCDSAGHGIKRMKYLLEHGIDPEVTDDYGRQAIHHALRNDDVRAFELLTEYGASLDARTSKGKSILHIAVRWTRRVAIVHALSKAGIMQLDLNARQDNGETAFGILKRRAEGYYWGAHYWEAPSLTTSEKFHLEVHIPIIRAFEALFQEIQEHQGVPLEDRYPALHIAALGKVIAAEQFGDTYSGSSEHGIYEVSGEDDHPTNHNSNEPTCAPPGAWPE